VEALDSPSPLLARYRLDEIDRELCLAFKSRKLAEASRLREELAGGADIRDHRGRRAVPLGASSLRKILDTPPPSSMTRSKMN